MTGRFHSQALNGAGRCLPSRLGTVAAEAALAHTGLLSQHRERKLVAELVVDPIMKHAEFVFCGLQVEWGPSGRTGSG